MRKVTQLHSHTRLYALSLSRFSSVLFTSPSIDISRLLLSFLSTLLFLLSLLSVFLSSLILSYTSLLFISPPLSLSFHPLFSTSFMLLRRHLSFSSPPRFAVGEGSRELRCNDGLLNICVVTACLHAYLSSSLACLLRSSFFGLCFLFGVCLSVRPCFYPFVCLFVFPCLSVCLSPFIFVCVLLIFCARFLIIILFECLLDFFFFTK